MIEDGDSKMERDEFVAAIEERVREEYGKLDAFHASQAPSKASP